jgi:hypothetical protein
MDINVIKNRILSEYDEIEYDIENSSDKTLGQLYGFIKRSRPFILKHPDIFHDEIKSIDGNILKLGNKMRDVIDLNRFKDFIRKELNKLDSYIRMTYEFCNGYELQGFELGVSMIDYSFCTLEDLDLMDGDLVKMKEDYDSYLNGFWPSLLNPIFDYYEDAEPMANEWWPESHWWVDVFNFIGLSYHSDIKFEDKIIYPDNLKRYRDGVKKFSRLKINHNQIVDYDKYMEIGSICIKSRDTICFKERYGPYKDIVYFNPETMVEVRVNESGRIMSVYIIGGDSEKMRRYMRRVAEVNRL